MKREEQVRKSMQQAKASIEIEGFVISKEQEDLVFKKLMGEITQEQFDKLALELASKAE
ncbi:hypothetical protein HNQ94_003462 [Salirhabdus euzebyi]|uniref:Antitoxin VbhA domain-containing protein n=1 Tax=Salirhabdus euzebyi TaxID=394506 RepID=A0A841Q973_9BACI|nr:antitoxin VbhA family protein [Salirhabdus euzebyi]MBB6454968.1 hypothetical protein [Salirhabdus euzebyi]